MLVYTVTFSESVFIQSYVRPAPSECVYASWYSEKIIKLGRFPPESDFVISLDWLTNTCHLCPNGSASAEDSLNSSVKQAKQRI